MIKQILIDGTTISKRIDGLSQYILNVVSRLPQRADRRYSIVVRPDECPAEYCELWRQKGIEILTAAIDPIGPWREIKFRRWLRLQRPFDAALVPSNQYPLSLSIPAVYVVHDLIYERYVGQLGKWGVLKRKWLHYNVAKGLQKARTIVAVSEFTKREILRCHPQTVAHKIHVVYEGWEHLQACCQQAPLNLPFREYILYIGSSRRHKNLQGLINAMRIASDHLPEGTGLVIAGDDRMLNARQRAQIAAMKGKIITTGWLSQEALNYCYARSQAVIFPSLCEGFGIPVLEAFYFRKPILLSNTSSLPEVAKEAAVYFDTNQPVDMALAIIHALQMSETEQTEWIRKGEQRLKTFSWQKTADEIDRLLTEL